MDHALLHLPFRLGDVVAGRYRVERVLGSGGMGVVVAGTHLGLGQRVAIKVMRPQAVSSHELVARFTREARATALLRSAHVARVLDVGELPGGLPFMVMEQLDGLDLSELARQYAEQRRPLAVPDVVDWILQACEALAEAHGAGIVHRDLKPANLFLTRTTDGAPLVKVLDFGVSKLAPDGEANAEGLTQTQSMIGSPHYMSPEQLVSAKTVDARADVWSLGAVLYRLVVGEPPYNASSTPELCVAILTRPYVSMLGRRADVPPGLDAVVARCLARDPAARYANVQELATALVPFGSGTASVLAERVRRIATSGSASNSVPETVPLAGFAPPREVRTVALSRPPAEAPSRAAPGGSGARVFVALAALLLVLGLAGIGVYAARRPGRGAPARTAPSVAAASVVAPAPSPTEAPLSVAPPSAVEATADAGAVSAAPAASPGPRPPAKRPAPAATPTGGGELPDFGGRK